MSSKTDLYAVADFSLIPIGTGHDPSIAPYVVECARILDNSGLKYQMHGNGTNIEGPWSEVCEAIHDCHVAVHARGAPRIATDIRIGTANKRDIPPEGENARKLRRVQEMLGRERVGSG